MFLLDHLPIGSKSRVQIIGSRIVSMFIGRCELRDSYAVIPEPLAQFGGKKEIEIWKLEAKLRAKYKDEIENYLYYDCKTLYDGIMTYRALAGTQKTIASNAWNFCKKLGIDPGRTDATHDDTFRPYFYGGRCECFKPGKHENIHLIDIRSAYPFAMKSDHCTGSEFVWDDDLGDRSQEEVARSFITLECWSNGAFPQRTGAGLSFPVGFGEFKITGWEYLTAKEFGLIKHERIISVRATAETINFSKYVDYWYGLKVATNKKEMPVEYLTYKRMMNALYGKLAQNPVNYWDYKIMPGGTPICDAPEPSPEAIEHCAKCGDKLVDHGWDLETEFGHHEIHVRPALWKYQYQYGDGWRAKKVFKNVATGASITGYTRAHLMRAMQLLGPQHIIYCDTDGIVCQQGADLSQLSYTDEIGNFEHEDTAPIGYFAGKKLYGIKLSKPGKKGEVVYKLAHKGSRLFEKAVTEIIDGEEITYVTRDNALAYERIVEACDGKTILWESHAPTFSIDGSADFVAREIRSTANRATTQRKRN